MIKICKHCEIEKNLDEFYTHKEGKFGKESVCISCKKIQKHNKRKKRLQGRIKTQLSFPENKKCFSCGEIKNVFYFSKDTGSNDGLNGRCKECESVRMKKKRKKLKQRTSIINPIEKICSHCKILKPKKEFYTVRSNSDGLSYYCKNCAKNNCNTYRTKNIENNIKKHNEDLFTGNKKCGHCKLIRPKIEFIKDLATADGLHNSCKSCHNESMIIAGHNRRARKKNINEIFTKEDADIIYDVCQNECLLCGTNDNLSIDHFYPISKGFALSIGNAIILCRSCNSKKGNKLPEQFFTKDFLHTALAIISVSRIIKYGVY